MKFEHEYKATMHPECSGKLCGTLCERLFSGYCDWEDEERVELETDKHNTEHYRHERCLRAEQE